jgi:hypothetical protein
LCRDSQGASWGGEADCGNARLWNLQCHFHYRDRPLKGDTSLNYST